VGEKLKTAPIVLLGLLGLVALVLAVIAIATAAQWAPRSRSRSWWSCSGQERRCDMP
jgi:hypothetical protein